MSALIGFLYSNEEPYTHTCNGNTNWTKGVKEGIQEVGEKWWREAWEEWRKGHRGGFDQNTMHRHMNLLNNRCKN